MTHDIVTDARSVEAAIDRLGGGARIATTDAVGGGCIANGSRVRLSDGRSFFVKQSRSLPAGMFAAEAKGLAALHSADGPRVPAVLAVGDEGAERFLVIEWIETAGRRSASGPDGRTVGERFGTELAALHREKRAHRCGFESDNYIGSTRQPNGWIEDWHDFYRERRLGFQVRLARDRGLLGADDARGFDRVLSRIGALLPLPDEPSLLHGDLWGGNYLVDHSGAPVLIDPAVYYGHREADIAMTRLFGGFPAGFERAYREVWPFEPGFEERVDLYNLYHVLNHANLFGGSYIARARSILRSYR